jgi:hypothetical protein
MTVAEEGTDLIVQLNTKAEKTLGDPAAFGSRIET